MIQEDSEITQETMDTNNVLTYHEGNETTYFLPAYLRMSFKNFKELNLSDLIAQINCSLLFSVYYQGLPEQYLDQVIAGNILLFNISESIKLNEEDVNISLQNKRSEKIFTFIIRKFLMTSAYPQIFWSPCQVIDLVLSVAVRPFSFTDKKTQRIHIKFNLMDHQNNFLKLSYSEDGSFGVYDLAQSRMRVQYSNKSKASTFMQLTAKENNIKRGCKTHPYPQSFQQTEYKFIQDNKPLKKKGKILNFKYAHFTIPIYKKPLPTLLTIFIPIWLLGLINLGIFFQDAQPSGKRAANVAALMVSYVALIPTIRDSLPPSSTIIFIEYLVYLQSFTSFLSMVEFILVRNDESTVERYNNDWQNQGLLMVCVAITGFTMVSVVILYLIYQLHWKPSYNRTADMQKDEKFNRKNWRNPDCDKHFYERTKQTS